MLTGRRPFVADSLIQIAHAVVYEQPPALAGSPGITATDRVIHRALAKKPADRYETAEAMAQDLRAVLLVADPGGPVRARPVTRLIVLPFRILRSDPETDFLAFSLPDAITGSLSGLESLVVRSSATAARVATDAPDLKRIAEAADVDIVMTATLLRAGDQLRVSTQLVEAPGGTVIWSLISQVPLGDVFKLQDELTRRIVASLSLPLTAREERMLKHDVPSSAMAYESYLRANQLSTDSAHWELARDLYLRCVEEDPRYSPAWDPTSRAREAERCRSGTFAGLVHACRYCGLLEGSVAAYERARRLDPKIRTSIAHTYFMLGDYARCIATEIDEPYVASLALGALGRGKEAISRLKGIEQGVHKVRDFVVAGRALLEGDRVESLGALHRIIESDFFDPEVCTTCRGSSPFSAN